jgi:SAM-dependent methyltransferase
MSRDIEWTGERCVPWANAAEVIYEHYHRYCFAARWLAEMDVLDAGCGEGYGTNIIAESAKSVTGVDIDPATVRHAKANYSRPHLRFSVGDVEDLGAFGSETFDAVVCFEVIEHVADHEAVMSGIKNVLRPSGILLMSTPDKLIYDARNDNNPFHVKELTAAEFELLLRRHFSNVALLGQSVSSGSTIAGLVGDIEPGAVAMTPLSRDGEAWSFSFAKKPTYLLAVASNEPLPRFPETSLLVDDGAELVAEAWGYHAQASRDLDKVRSELESAHAENIALKSCLEEATSARAGLQGEFIAARESLEKELALTRRKVEEATLKFVRTEARLDTIVLERERLRSELRQEVGLSEELFRELSRVRSSLPVSAWPQYEALRDRALRKGSKTRDLYDKVAHALLTMREPGAW